MVVQSVEERLANLEKDNKKLHHELERLQAVHEILNMEHKMQWFHTNNRDYAIMDSMSKKAPDVRVYYGNLGYWEGPQEVLKSGKVFPPHVVGHMPIHLMSNPVIEVAGDGKTARGVWVAIGFVANKDRKTGKPTAGWEWNRYGIDFIKEDGKWKVLHHHIFDLFNVPWNGDWAEQFSKPKELPHRDLPDDIKPNYPPTSLDVGYNPDVELPYIPPPEPYETWDPKQMY